jgi:tetratricopeptide (TPR) repeat protein
MVMVKNTGISLVSSDSGKTWIPNTTFLTSAKSEDIVIQLFSTSRLLQAILASTFLISACDGRLWAQQNDAQLNAVQQNNAQQVPMQQAANALFAASKWKQAAQLYTQITATEPANGEAWQNLGECYIQLGKLKESLQAFTNAVQQNFRPVLNKVNVARVQIALGNTRQALDALKEVEASGKAPLLRAYIAGASEFQKLQDNPEYQQFLKSTIPCQTAEFRQFDFWIGDWAVQNPTGRKVGDNLVTREQDGCILIEHWKSGRGIETGTSFNYYDIRDKKFHQIYLDNSGNAGAFPPMAGGLVDNKMVMLSDENVSPVFRWTWYVISPGKVRQMAEQSNDGQKTWQIVWDSTYVNKAQQASK